MLDIADAQRIILDSVAPLEPESTPLLAASGRVLADDVFAARAFPPWDNASMDGYAVHASDVLEGAQLPVIATIPAGGTPPRPLERGEAMKIMTGAPVPSGADSVVRIEDTDAGATAVRIRSVRDAHKNIRVRGEDYSPGDLLLTRGTRLDAAQLGLLASAGVITVSVVRPPRVAIFSTGDELVEAGETLTPDRIVSVNSVTLPALVRDAGAQPLYLGIARDSRDSVRSFFERCEGVDLILTSGGVSVGEFDHLKQVAAELGEQRFWKVRMRPGAPLAFGRIGATPWAGTSGNPVSAVVTFELLVRPVIRRMLGLTQLFRRTVPAELEETVRIAAPLMHFLRATLTSHTGGGFTVRLCGTQSSAAMLPLARANALLVVPPDRDTYQRGDTLRAIPLNSDVAYAEQQVLA